MLFETLFVFLETNIGGFSFLGYCLGMYVKA